MESQVILKTQDIFILLSYLNTDISHHKFYTRLLFNIYLLPQDEIFPLDIVATFFNNLSSDVQELLVEEVAQFPTKIPAKTNNQVNHRLLLVNNTAV